MAVVVEELAEVEPLRVVAAQADFDEEDGFVNSQCKNGQGQIRQRYSRVLRATQRLLAGEQTTQK